MTTATMTDLSLDTERLRHELLRYACGISREPSLAEDAVQDTFLTYLKNQEKHAQTPARTWFFRVCRSRLVDRMRKEGRHAAFAAESNNSAADPFAAGGAPDPSPRRQAEASERRKHLLDLVSALPEAQQEVLRLKFQADMSYGEIAEITGRAVGTVGALIHHAMTRLKELASGDPELSNA